MNLNLVTADYLNPQHAKDLVFLLNQYACDPAGGGKELNIHIRENLVAELAKLPFAFSILCYANNEPVGLANCFVLFSTFKCKLAINIHDLAVLKDYRQQGISQLLLGEVEKVAKGKGACKIVLEVLEKNIAARQAYAKFGLVGYEIRSEVWQSNFSRKSSEMTDKRTMITFDRGGSCFNFRVAGIAVDNNYVLLHQAQGDSFWTVPGGRVEIGEVGLQALIREMKEELNEDIEVVRLLWVIENFFKYAQKDYHEIAFYYLMQFPKRSSYLTKDSSFTGVEADNHLEFRWFPIDSVVLKQLPLLPAFLQQSLSNLPNSVEHIVEG